MHKYFLSLLFIINVCLGFSQTTFSISDQITGKPIEGVHVYFGTGKETKVSVSNVEGKITTKLKLSIGTQIKLTHIAYESLELTIKELKKEYDVRLTPLLNTLDNVVLTGDIVPISKKEAHYDVITVSEETVEKLGAVDAAQVLQWQNGIQISRDPILGSSVSINGMTGEHVKIIVDGVEMNGRSDGFVDLEQIQIQENQSVEVVKGPVSLEYGSNALGGIVQFVSNDEDIRDSIGGSVRVLAENTGTYKTTAHFVEAGKKHSLNIYFNRTYFDGWHSNDPFWESFNAQVADSSRVKSWNPKRFVNGKVKYDVTLNKLRLTNLMFYQNEGIKEKGFPFVAPSYLRAKDSEVETHRIFAQSQLKGLFSDHHRFKLIVNGQFYTRFRKSYIKDLSNLSVVDGSEVRDTIEYNSYQMRFQGKLSKIKNHDISYGADVLYDEIVGERIENNKKTLVSYGAYLKDLYNITDKTSVQAGLRMSYFTNGEAALTPSLSSRIELKDKSILRISLSRGFRNPGLKDLYFEFIDNNHHIIGNEGLKPEKSYHINVGFNKQFKGGFVLENGLFYNNMTDKIELIQSSENASWFTYGNFSGYEGYGGHLNVLKRVGKFDFRVGYQLVSDRVLEDRIPDNWVVRHEITSGIDARLGKKSILSLFVKWNSEKSTFRYDVNNNTERFIQEAFTFADLGYQYRLNDHLDFGLWVRNILDVTNIANNGGGAHSSSSQSIARGRMLQLQIRYKL